MGEAGKRIFTWQGEGGHRFENRQGGGAEGRLGKRKWSSNTSSHKVRSKSMPRNVTVKKGKIYSCL